MKYILFLFLKSFSYLLMGYLLYILYSRNLEKFQNGNKGSIFYKAKIIKTKISLFCVVLVLAFFAIGSLREATGLMN